MHRYPASIIAIKKATFLAIITILHDIICILMRFLLFCFVDFNPRWEFMFQTCCCFVPIRSELRRLRVFLAGGSCTTTRRGEIRVRRCSSGQFLTSLSTRAWTVPGSTLCWTPRCTNKCTTRSTSSGTPTPTRCPGRSATTSEMT